MIHNWQDLYVDVEIARLTIVRLTSERDAARAEAQAAGERLAEEQVKRGVSEPLLLKLRDALQPRAGETIIAAARRAASVARDAEELTVRLQRSGPRVCVAALVEDGAGRLLLVRHGERGLELPGGRHELGETWRAGLSRELREETGLEVELADANPLALDELPVNGAQYQNLILIARGKASGEPMAADPDGKIVEARWYARSEVPTEELSKIASAGVVREWVTS